MSARTWVYSRLTQTPALSALIGDDNPRVYAKKSMTSGVEVHPYIVYKMGNSTAVGLSERDDAEVQFVQIWIHDYKDEVVADYARIDEVITEVKRALQVDPTESGLWQAQFLETSQDLDDDTLNTVFRYLRYQVIKREI